MQNVSFVRKTSKKPTCDEDIELHSMDKDYRRM